MFEKASVNEYINDKTYYTGWDTEYYSGSKLITSQFYFKNVFVNNYEMIENIDRLLDIRTIENFGTVFIYDDRSITSGINFAAIFSSRLKNMSKLCPFGQFERMVLCTFYSNAELSALFPTLDDLRSLKIAQGDII